MISIEDLRLAVTLARSESLSAAARTLNVSPPALSMRLRKLETLLGLTLASPLTQAADPVSLTLYNGQHKEVGDAVAKAFEAKTGIHVNVRKGSSNQLASQIVEEGDRSPADVIYTEESPPLNKLGEQGLLAKTDQRVFGKQGLMDDTQAAVVQMNVVLKDASNTLKKLDAVLADQ